jgi:hypothetical protein
MAANVYFLIIASPSRTGCTMHDALSRPGRVDDDEADATIKLSGVLISRFT